MASRRGTGDRVSCREVRARRGAGRAAVVWRKKRNSAAAAMAFLTGKIGTAVVCGSVFGKEKASTTSRMRHCH
jgi:hypothetical protein